jgi:hypothetical protein
MSRHLVALLLLGVVASCGNDVQVRLLNLLHYDDFNGSTVDSAKWSVDLTGTPASGPASVTVANGQATLDFNATSGDLQSSLVFPLALTNSIGTITARATVLSMAENPGSIVRFRLYARQYKDNKYASGPAPDRTSDVFPQLRIRGGQIQAMVQRCTVAACNSGTETPFGPTVLGTAALNQAYVLTMRWDGGTKFQFDVEGVGSAMFDASEGGAYANIGPSGSPKAKVEVIADSGAPTIGAATATVDYVNCGRWDADLC